MTSLLPLLTYISIISTHLNLLFLLHWHGKSSESSKLNISHIEILFEVGSTGNSPHFDRRDETGFSVIKRDVIITATLRCYSQISFSLAYINI